MTTPAPTLQALLQRAQLQTQANRYSFLRQTADRKLITNLSTK